MRFLRGAELNEVNWPTVYASGPKGYTDLCPIDRVSVPSKVAVKIRLAAL
jgi:hypothetical protein